MTDWKQVAYQSAVKAGHPDPNMFVRQMMAESGLNPNARSPVGATGIAQIMPATAKGWGVNPNDPYASLDAAAKAMTKYIKSYNGNAAMALAAYNAGPGAVAQYNGVPPYSETRNYIKKIMGGKPVQIPQGQPQQSQTYAPGPQVDRTAVSNQINRINYAYMDAPELAQPHVDKLVKTLGGGGLAATSTDTTPGGAGKGAYGYFRTPNGLVQNRRPGEAPWQFFQRLGQVGFGLQNDPGNTQTTGGQHTTGSLHYAGQAVDFGNAKNDKAKLDAFYNWLKPRQESVGYEELIWQAPDHYDHLHIGGSGPTPPPIRPANSRRRPVKKNRVPR